MTRRAVSDLVSFVLIFGIIMSGATLALVVGQEQISDIGNSEQAANAEHAMLLLGQNLNGLDQSRSASTVSTVNLNDGSLASTTGSNVDVTVSNHTTPGPTWSEPIGSVPTGGIDYRIEDTVIRYENGVVLRSDEGNGIARTETRMICIPDEQAIVSIITLNTRGVQQVGSGRVSVVGYQEETELLYPLNRSGAGSALNATRVDVEVTSEHEDVWDETMGENGWTNLAVGEYRCDVGPDGQVHVRRTVIDLAFER